jgi:Domain of unknown function (DUF5666)
MMNKIRLLSFLIITAVAAAAFAVPYAEEQSSTVEGEISSVERNNQRIRIHDDTIVIDTSRITVAYDELRRGVYVRVVVDPLPEPHGPGMPQEDFSGPLVARSLAIVTPPATRMIGVVGQMHPIRRSFQLLGLEIFVNEATKFSGNMPNGDPVRGLFDLPPTTTIIVELAKKSTPTALSVHMLEHMPVQNIVTQGTLHQIRGDQWTLIELGGRITELTVPAGVATGTPLPGDTVMVAARVEPERTVAQHVEVIRAVPLRVYGTLTARSAQSIVVNVDERGSTTFRISEGTRFLDDPQPGDRVWVEAEYQQDGTLLARNVLKQTPQPEPERLTIEGTVTAQDGPRWTVGEYSVLILEQTEITGTPSVGDRVRVRGLGYADAKQLTAVTVEEL